MIGKEVTLQDIVLELNELQPEVQPVDLFCEEELPNEQQEREEEPQIERASYKVVAPCGCCKVKLRIFISATDFVIRSFQQLLIDELQLLCPDCRGNCKHGGS